MPERRLPRPDQTTPFDPEACAHHVQLLQAWHCARPVLYQSRRHFIRGFTGNSPGSQCELIVYLAGLPGGVDSAEIQVPLFEITAG